MATFAPVISVHQQLHIPVHAAWRLKLFGPASMPGDTATLSPQRVLGDSVGIGFAWSIPAPTFAPLSLQRPTHPIPTSVYPTYPLPL
eukprot:97275-Rhodomonas_salina.3